MNRFRWIVSAHALCGASLGHAEELALDSPRADRWRLILRKVDPSILEDTARSLCSFRIPLPSMNRKKGLQFFERTVHLLAEQLDQEITHAPPKSNLTDQLRALAVYLREGAGDIPERISTYFGDRIKDQHELDTWDYDLRNQTLLHRNAAGYYEFAHKSLAEYFVAFKFAAELGCLAAEFAQTYCEANGQPPSRSKISGALRLRLTDPRSCQPSVRFER